MKKTNQPYGKLKKIFLILLAIIILLLLQQLTLSVFDVPQWLVPKPTTVIKVFYSDFDMLCDHTCYTLLSSLSGLGISVFLAVIIALTLDIFPVLKSSTRPILVATQTIPIISIAPLLIIWFGFGITSKIAVVIIITFFPVCVSLLDALSRADQDMINLLKSMGATRIEIYRYVKIPSAIPDFFTGLKVSSAYTIMGAIIGEWLGAEKGLGLYMNNAQKSFRPDRVFAAILVVMIASLVLHRVIELLDHSLCAWKYRNTSNQTN